MVICFSLCALCRTSLVLTTLFLCRYIRSVVYRGDKILMKVFIFLILLAQLAFSFVLVGDH